jgi:Zn-finger nucleic acid-binding protein
VSPFTGHAQDETYNQLMKCPIDQIELEKKNYESLVEIDECPKCSGIWLDQGELEKIQDIQENDYSEDLKKVPNYVTAAYEQARQQNAADITCPNCKVEMFKKEASMASQIVIDKCPKCFGVWLNKGELKALELLFERGRLETSEIREEFWSKFSRIFG